MFLIHQTALTLHIIIGSGALLLFWVPMLGRKGSQNHRRFGRYFVWGMYAVSGSGLLMSSLDLIFPLSVHAAGVELSPAEERSVRAEVRDFALFLFSLSVLVLTSTRQGLLTIRHKDDRAPLRTAPQSLLCAGLAGVGLLLLARGIQDGNILFLIFGSLQLLTGLQNLHYNFKPVLREREWWLAHLSSIIGSGIGAYTAFFVFGGSRLFSGLFGDAFSNYSIVLWVAPGIIGSIAIGVLTRRYKRRIGGNWLVSRARRRAALLG